MTFKKQNGVPSSKRPARNTLIRRYGPANIPVNSATLRLAGFGKKNSKGNALLVLPWTFWVAVLAATAALLTLVGSLFGTD
jgi:hypothetical protein